MASVFLSYQVSVMIQVVYRKQPPYTNSTRHLGMFHLVWIPVLARALK